MITARGGILDVDLSFSQSQVALDFLNLKRSRAHVKLVVFPDKDLDGGVYGTVVQQVGTEGYPSLRLSQVLLADGEGEVMKLLEEFVNRADSGAADDFRLAEEESEDPVDQARFEGDIG